MLGNCMAINTSTDSHDDNSLIDQLIAGDERAFCVLINRHHGLLLTIARAIIGDTFAEDVVQDAWLAVHKHICNFERRSSLKTWIITIVSNEAKSRLRREARLVSLEQLDGETPGSYLDGNNFKGDGHWKNPIPHWDNESPEALLEEKQLQACIAKTLSLLPPTQKAAFVLRDLEQQSFEDICNILHISASNVRVLVHRARLALMQVIDRYQETGTC